MKIISKISAPAINGVIKGFRKVTTRRNVMRIAGIVHSLVPTESATEFKGEFRAWNEAGEQFVSPKCVLITAIETVLQPVVAANKGKAVGFAFDVFIEPNSAAPLGYTYDVSAIVSPAVFNPLDEILKNVSPIVAVQPELPPVDPVPPTDGAPAGEAAPEPVAKPKKK